MKMIKMYRRISRDFRADYECEHCKHQMKNKSGYADNNYYDNVIPNVHCEECGLNSNGETKEQREDNNKRIYRF